MCVCVCLVRGLPDTEWETLQTGRAFEPSEAGCCEMSQTNTHLQYTQTHTHTHLFILSVLVLTAVVSQTCAEYWFLLFVSLASLTESWLNFKRSRLEQKTSRLQNQLLQKTNKNEIKRTPVKRFVFYLKKMWACPVHALALLWVVARRFWLVARVVILLLIFVLKPQ